MKSPNKKRAVSYSAPALAILFCLSASGLLFAQGGRERLTVAYAAMNPTMLPLWIAVDKGFFDAERLDAQLLFIRTSPTILSAMISGEVQAAYTGGTAALSAATRGLDLQIVSTNSSRLTYDIVARPEIKKPADLRGKVFGVQALGGSVWMGGMAGLEYLGLDAARDNIKVIAAGDQTVLAQALESRRIDATVLEKPSSTELKLKGFVLLAELSKADIYLARIGLTFRRSFIQKRTETVRRSVRALVRATGYLFFPPNRATVIETIVKKLGIQSPAVAATAYDNVLQSLDQRPYPSTRGLKNIQRLLGNLNPDVARIPVESVVDMSFMEELDKSGFINEALRSGGRMP